MHPQRAAVHEYFDLPPQSIHEMRSRVEIEADQIDYGVTTQLGDRFPERPVALGGAAVERYILDRFPFGRVMIGFAQSAGNRDYFVRVIYKTRNQPRTDMTGGSEDYCAQPGTAFRSSRMFMLWLGSG
jgi:hypothetical protein